MAAIIPLLDMFINDIMQQPKSTSSSSSSSQPPRVSQSCSGSGNEISKFPTLSNIGIAFYETDSQFVVHADVPGVSKEAIKVTIKPVRLLSISYERTDPLFASSEIIRPESDLRVLPRSPNNNVWYRNELHYGKFTRSITLPPIVNIKDVKTSVENGTLTITFGKNPSDDVLEIPVN